MMWAVAPGPWYNYQRHGDPSRTMRLYFASALLIVVACSRGAAPKGDVSRAMIIFDTQDFVIAQLTADDRLLDWQGHDAGAYDDHGSVLTVVGVAVPLAKVAHVESPRAIVLSLPYGTWHVLVGEDGTITVDGKRFGRVEGFVGSEAGARRMEALLLAVTALPRRRAEPVDAAIPDGVADQEPPPPPPSPPNHVR
jgi:hypothetical protein